MNEEEPASQAYLKYLDAAVVDPNNHLCNLNAGRMYLSRDMYNEAIEKLQSATGLKPSSTEARLV